jgi:uncharacterized membrane protein YgcG
MRLSARIVVLLCLLTLPFVSTRAQSERIENFHSDIHLLDDGTLLVKETIKIFSTGNQIRHGIFREFPTRYHDPLNNNYVVGFDWRGATLDGYPEPSRVEDYSNGKRIYLGDPKLYVSPGEHTYELNYSTNRQLGFFPDHDQLFWNVTGNGWGFVIDAASATVTLPPQIVPSEVSLDGFTGPQGARDKNFTGSFDDGKLQFQSTRPLAPREGLSIILSWPKGLIAPPSPQQKWNYFFADNRDALILLTALLLIAVYYAIVWSAVGRDPQSGVIMPLYEPPANLSPAAMRYLVRMGFDNKTFASAILDMAARGFLKIKFQAGSYTLYRTPADNRALTPDEQQLAAVMFSGRDQLWLHSENHTLISAGIKVLKARLKTFEQKIYFLTNGQFLVPAIIFSILVAFVVAYLKSPPTVLIIAFLAFWLSIWSIAVAALIIGAYTAWKEFLAANSTASSSAPSSTQLAVAKSPLAKALLLTIFAIPFTGFEIMALVFLTKFTSISMTIFLIASIALHILFRHLLKAPTAAGRKLLDQVEGFKLFLGAVDGDRLNRINPPDQTPETFEKFLPYALALDLEQAWAQKFSGILNAASLSPNSGDSSGYTPSFYSGSNWSGIAGGSFASDFAGSFTSAISSSSSAPGSSDGGGGGSGGGGGGGGGGGW